ncbi:hypothetical protein BOX15_Mlig000112g3 [Macrostomum lignano]|uniref:UBC core domain-containing protein n=1 Tax=Macrostomum lignano TaxID=282301 RepID=A0A267EPH3_9PLAT|nr:hypothetical protein BOX15_Mlig000112g3 [Macrostomum lignano]
MASSVVHSRAYLLIEQELLKFERNPVKGIRVYPTRAGNLFSLSAKIKGLPDTLWDGGVLKLRLRFSESYNYVPPEANFVTVPFHPNVEPDTGRVACPYLDDPQKWNASVSLADLLSSIQQQLTEPNAQLILNPEAAEMMSTDYEQYKSVVAQCVQMSQIVENSPDKLRPFSPSGDDENPDASGGVRQPVEIEYDLDYLNRPPPKPQKPSQRKISFETYHADWSKLATSKTVDREPFNPASIWHSDTLSAKIESHRRLKYGNSGQPKQKQQQKQLESNLERLDQMRRIYLAQRHASNVSTSRSLMSDIKKQPQPPHQRSQLHQFDNEEDEVEAEDLVQWTRDLPNDEAERIKA